MKTFKLINGTRYPQLIEGDMYLGHREPFMEYSVKHYVKKYPQDWEVFDI